MNILRDLTQKAYNDCERAISRTMSLLDSDEDKFSLIVSIGVNLINHSLENIEKEGINQAAYNSLVDSIKSRIDNLHEDSNVKGN